VARIEPIKVEVEVTVNEIPKRGFYVDSNGRVYLDGVRTTGKGIKPMLDPPPKTFAEEVKMMAEDNAPVATSMAKIWDKTFQDGSWSDKHDGKEKEESWPAGPMDIVFRKDGTQSISPQVWENNKLNELDEAVAEANNNVADIADVVIDLVENDMQLIKVQADSMQQQISALQSVDIEDDYEGEKLDSFKTRTKDAIQEAGYILDDMENADRMLQAREIKRSCLAENKRLNVDAQTRVQERLAKLRQTHDDIQKERGKRTPLWQTCAVVLFSVLLAVALLVAIILVL